MTVALFAGIRVRNLTAARGWPAGLETYSSGVPKATYRDDDGNESGVGRDRHVA